MSFFSCLLTLSFMLHINDAKRTQLLESLQCLNDYKSFVSCTWSESQDVQKLIQMNLFYKTKINNGFKQMTHMDSQRWNCYRNQTYFAAIDKDYYTFKPERKLEAQLNVSLFDNVQLSPPKELDISLTEEGNFLLTWKADGGTNENRWLDETLDYHIVYKREWEPWERSTSVFVSNVSHCLLHRDNLVPGSTYVARVRSKPHQDSHPSSYYSEWSSVVNWTAQEGDEAQPKNLHCLFNGLDRLNCSWEVRRELTGSVSFALFYKISLESKEKQCSPVEEKGLPDTSHVLQSCEINVTNPKRLSQYLITVRPKEDEKMIAPVKNIKMDPPYELSVKKLNKLQWKDIKSDYTRLYQIIYWEAKMPEKIHLQNISEFSQFIFIFQSLEPGTHYKAKMRAKAHSGAYDGPWSEWSKECEWVTESELPLWSFALVVPVIILAMMGVCFSKRYILRKKNEWDKNIPRPPSTFLLPSYFKKVQLLDSFEESSRHRSLEEEEFNRNNALNRSILVTCSNSLWDRSGEKRLLSAVFQNTEITRFSEVKPDQSLSHAEPSPKLTCSHNVEMGLSQQVFDFNGPYLMYLQESPMPDVQEVAASLETKETSVLMQYVILPHGSCLQAFPMGKGKRTTPPPCTVHSEREKKLALSGRRQEVSEGQMASGILEKGENKNQKPQSATITNNNSQNGILDYFTTEDLSKNMKGSSSLLSPMMAIKEEMLTCATMETSASQLSQTTSGLSSSELKQKKTDSVVPHEDQAPAVPSETSQDLFGEYFMAFPGTLESMPKERPALSTKDPGQNKSFLVFNPDGKSPIFLSQVGEYCFFPSTKPVTKPQEGYMGHQLAEDSHPLTKQPHGSKFVENEPQTISHICKV